MTHATRPTSTHTRTHTQRDSKLSKDQAERAAPPPSSARDSNAQFAGSCFRGLGASQPGRSALGARRFAIATEAAETAAAAELAASERSRAAASAQELQQLQIPFLSYLPGAECSPTFFDLQRSDTGNVR